MRTVSNPGLRAVELAAERPGIAPRRFGSLLLGAAALLFAGLVAALALTGPLSWLVGFVYIAYDTWLLGHMVRTSRRSIGSQLAAPERALPVGPALAARPSLTVLIAARNERLALPAALDALFAQDDPADRIIIIDDGSTDDTLAYLTERFGLRFRVGERLAVSPYMPT